MWPRHPNMTGGLLRISIVQRLLHQKMGLNFARNPKMLSDIVCLHCMMLHDVAFVCSKERQTDQQTDTPSPRCFVA